jgi:hypothetical protein
MTVRTRTRAGTDQPRPTFSAGGKRGNVDEFFESMVAGRRALRTVQDSFIKLAWMAWSDKHRVTDRDHFSAPFLRSDLFGVLTGAGEGA